ncbi:MAG: RNase adapter RapZ, partial [Gammaproteobacteria bacterium]
MKLVIVSGFSGSGKTIALNTLEDMGYYCVDNLPASLLHTFSHEIQHNAGIIEQVAVGIDVRNLTRQFEHYNSILKSLEKDDINYEIIFLRCDDNVLIKRFSETRRKHPLSNKQTTLADAIQREKRLLEPLAERADFTIDTSNT